ncbi:MAG: MerR family transcriptional regulator [Lachnospiraceae bacterium]|nr:MerR family transcriptional regulator [Lachnospiraceae bacterium]
MEGQYSVKEMTQKLGIEAHMLRYWEKELELDIPRDSKGRRTYGEDEARTLELVSTYKKEGKPLRMIKSLIRQPGQEEGAEEEPERKILIYRPGKEEAQEKGAFGQEAADRRAPGKKSTDMELLDKTASDSELLDTESAENMSRTKSLRLQELLSQMVAEAVRESSEAAILEMKDSILKELDYQFRLQGEREEELQEKLFRAQEEHFAQLDTILREKNDRRKKRLWG